MDAEEKHLEVKRFKLVKKDLESKNREREREEERKCVRAGKRNKNRTFSGSCLHRKREKVT